MFFFDSVQGEPHFDSALTLHKLRKLTGIHTIYQNGKTAVMSLHDLAVKIQLTPQPEYDDFAAALHQLGDKAPDLFPRVYAHRPGLTVLELLTPTSAGDAARIDDFLWQLDRFTCDHSPATPPDHLKPAIALLTALKDKLSYRANWSFLPANIMRRGNALVVLEALESACLMPFGKDDSLIEKEDFFFDPETRLLRLYLQGSSVMVPAQYRFLADQGVFVLPGPGGMSEILDPLALFHQLHSLRR